MRCTNPHKVWVLNKHGRKLDDDVRFRRDMYPVSFVYPRGNEDYYREVIIPCQKCLGCALDRRDAWAVRASLELSCHLEASFLTLTYNDAHLPISGESGLPTLRRRDLTLFIKRLRRHLFPLKIRYFGCGEYGSRFDRPHYHLIIFGWMPKQKDLRLLNGSTSIFRCPELESLWSDSKGEPIGFVSVAPADDGCVRYVAGYVAKKFGSIPPEGVTPNFCACSLRPAIGFPWFEKFGHSLLKFEGDQMFFPSIHLMDFTTHDFPPVFRAWFKRRFPDEYQTFLDFNDYKLARVESREVLRARSELHRVISERAKVKGGRNL